MKNVILKITSIFVIVLGFFAINISSVKADPPASLEFTYKAEERALKDTVNGNSVRYRKATLGPSFAFCANYNKALPTATTLQFSEKLPAEALRVLVDGYPNNDYSQQFGLNPDDSDEAKYLTTQLALWDVLKKTTSGGTNAVFNMDNLVPQQGLENVMPRVLQAAKNLSAYAIENPLSYGNSSVDIDTSSYQLVENGDFLVAGPYKLISNGFIVSNITVSWGNDAPATVNTMNRAGVVKKEFNADEEIFVIVNKSELNANFNINFNINGATYFAALYKGKDAKWQGFATIVSEPVSLSETVPISWSTDMGNITVIKRDQNDEKIAGVRFELRDTNNIKIADGVTNSKGNLEFRNVQTGKYKIVEASSPKGYIAETEPKYVTLTAGKSEVVYFTNIKLQTYLKIKKVDEEGNPIKNVTFRILNESHKLVQKITTDSKGIAKSDILPPGVYYYQEIEAPSNFEIDKKEYKFVVTEKTGETIEVTLKNKLIPIPEDPIPDDPTPEEPGVDPKGRFKIYKVDEFGEQLEGVKFELYDKNMKRIETLKTDSSGYAVSKILDLGKYYYKEVSVPSKDLIFDDEVKEFDLTEDGQIVTITVRNYYKKGYLQIIKKDQYGTPIPGVIFEIYSKDNTDEPVETITTNSDGVANTKLLVKGTYYYKEISAPSNVIINSDLQKFEIKEDNQIVTVEVTNELIEGQIKVVKKDEDNKPIEGVVFNITNEDNSTIYDKITTDSKGIAISKKLEIGTYYLREVSAPKEFVVSDEVISFEINDKTTMVEKELVNKRKKAKLSILKLDKDDNTTPIPDVKFEILDSNKKVIETLVTDANGKAETDELELGTYYYKEISTPKNYSFDNSEYEFKIEEDNVNVEKTIYNTLKRLPVTGGFISSDIIIIIIVTLGCTVFYILLKMLISYLQNR